MKGIRQFLSAVSLTALVLLAGCGGGGGSSTTTTPITNAQLAIVANLPIGLEGFPYYGTLTAIHGVAPFTWSVDSSTPLPAGLSFDPAKGTVSGTPTSGGGANVAFIVKDSSNPPQTVRTQFLIGIADPLGLKVFQNIQLTEYQDLSQAFATESGGVGPYTFTIVQGSFPPGVKIDPSTGSLRGSALAAGTFNVVVAVQDSYSPPEVVTQPGTVVVTGAPLTLGTSMNGASLILNRPYSTTIYASGGTPPYSFQINSGSLPPGLSLTDPVNGIVSGTPTQVGGYIFQISAQDSASMTQYLSVYGSVRSALGRNDSPATATPISNASYSGSISPALDVTGSLAPDTDYYKVIGAAGSTMHFETTAKRMNANNPLDTVIELTDVNGGRLATGCNQPGGSSDFTSVCLNDDISASPHVQDSMLDYKVPGASGTQTFLVHVLDWSGNARPDMTYTLQVNGAVEPLTAYSVSFSAVVGKSYSQPLSYVGGSGTVTFTVTGGNLPPGLTLSGTNISGTPTTAGNYSFTVQATDQSTPPQQSTASLSLSVVNALTITTTQVPNGTVGNPYSFQFVSSGGLSPINWSCNFPPPGLMFNINGTLSGTPTQSGTYTMQVRANDAGFYPAIGQTATQTFTMAIQ